MRISPKRTIYLILAASILTVGLIAWEKLSGYELLFLLVVADVATFDSKNSFFRLAHVLIFFAIVASLFISILS